MKDDGMAEMVAMVDSSRHSKHKAGDRPNKMPNPPIHVKMVKSYVWTIRYIAFILTLILLLLAKGFGWI